MKFTLTTANYMSILTLLPEVSGAFTFGSTSEAFSLIREAYKRLSFVKAKNLSTVADLTCKLMTEISEELIGFCKKIFI